MMATCRRNGRDDLCLMHMIDTCSFRTSTHVQDLLQTVLQVCKQKSLSKIPSLLASTIEAFHPSRPHVYVSNARFQAMLTDNMTVAPKSNPPYSVL